MLELHFTACSRTLVLPFGNLEKLAVFLYRQATIASHLGLKFSWQTFSIDNQGNRNLIPQWRVFDAVQR